MTNDFGELFVECFFSTWIFPMISSLTKHFYVMVGMRSLGLRRDIDNPVGKAGDWMGLCQGS